VPDATRASHALRIPLPADFDFGWTTRFLATREVPAIESVRADEFRRVVRLPGGDPAFVRIRYRAEESSLDADCATLSPDALGEVVCRMFDLHADLEHFRARVHADPVLGPVVRSNPPGLRLPQLIDPFECLVRAILGQQVSVQAATTLTDRLVRLVAEPGPAGEDAPGFAFPSPAAVADAGADRLRGIGLTRARAATVHSAAEALASGALNLAALRTAPAEEAERALCALPGVGPWTASYVRMRSLGAHDAFPAADLGVIRALAARGVARSEILRVAEGWRPWRAYATLHLWHSLAG
jgi:3-methyladenine DNA glycosylase/8-oxoguanine DNA glycosylase